jgi:CubicO group peptidase (beta-lactamase class C family)
MSPRAFRPLLAASLAALALLPPGSGHGAATAPALDSLRTRVATIVESTGAPSLALAVTRGGRIVWEEGYGFADSARLEPATPATLYSIASVTKPITATALMRLVEAGRIDLDAPANHYLEPRTRITGLAGAAAGATVRRLLSHTAGLPPHYRFFYAGGAITRPGMDEAIARYGIAVYPPGAVYDYSNLGYGVLETILEGVARRSYADIVRDEVFAPLGMTHSTVGTGAGLRHAAPRWDARGAALPPYDFDHRGASAVWSSAHELARFALFHLGTPGAGSLLRDETRRLMQRVATPGDSLRGYGLGWDVQRERGTTVVAHHGSMPGAEATLRLYPEHDLAIVVLSNARRGAAFAAAEAIADAFLPPRDDAADAPPPTTNPPLQPALEGSWTGSLRTYDGNATPFELSVRGDSVHVRLGGPPTPWQPLQSARFIDGIQVLWGALAATIPTEDARRAPHDVVLSLWFDRARSRLVGAATAVLKDVPPSGGMSSYVELARKTGP